jgi:hypothetical protein
MMLSDSVVFWCISGSEKNCHKDSKAQRFTKKLTESWYYLHKPVYFECALKYVFMKNRSAY